MITKSCSLIWVVPKIKFSCGPSWGETVPIDGTRVNVRFTSSKTRRSSLSREAARCPARRQS